MPHTDLTKQLRVRVYWIAGATTAFLTLSALIAADYKLGLLALIFSLLLFANGWLNQDSLAEQSATPLSHVVVGFLGLVTLLSFTVAPNMAEPWCYLFPLIVFLIYRLRVATMLTAVYSVLVAFSLIQFYHEPGKVQIFFSFVLCLAMTLAFVYLREIKEQQLKPLRRTDHLTLASNREYLTQDLDKEIQRSEREGTDLAVLALAIDPDALEGRSSESLDYLLNRLGRTLHENLRLFDSYYRYSQCEFVVLLPHSNTKKAIKTAEKLRVQCKKQLSSGDETLTVSIGIVSLNVGDDAESLIRNAQQALDGARARGHNQTCSHLELEQSEMEKPDGAAHD